MHIISKTTMSVEPLCGWSRNPPRGITAIHINQRKLKLEKDQNENFHTLLIVKHQKNPNSSSQFLKSNAQMIKTQENKITMNQNWHKPNFKEWEDYGWRGRWGDLGGRMLDTFGGIRNFKVNGSKRNRARKELGFFFFFKDIMLLAW